MSAFNQKEPVASKRDDAFWLTSTPALVALVTASVGIIFRLGPMWHYLADGAAALAVLSVLWEVQRQRLRSAVRTAGQIDELLNLLRNAKAGLSSAELKTIEAELQRLQLDVLSRATLRR